MDKSLSVFTRLVNAALIATKILKLEIRALSLNRFGKKGKIKTVLRYNFCCLTLRVAEYLHMLCMELFP